MKNWKAILKVLWDNRKAEIALVAAAVALAREIIQGTTGH